MRNGSAALVLLALIAAPAAAHASGVSVRWNTCLGDGGLANRSFACSGCTSSGAALVGSFVLATDRQQVTGVKLVLDVATDSPTLPDWWQLATGACRQGALTVNGVIPGAANNCVDWANGLASAGAVSYTVGYSGSNTARITCRLDVPPADAVDLVADQEYFAANVRINISKFAGANACAGCTVPACIAMSAIRLYQAGSPDVTTLSGPANGLDSHYVTWQGGGSLSGGCGIPDTAGFRVNAIVVGRGSVARSRDVDIYPPGSPLTLSAKPSMGARFAGWSGDTTTVQDTLALTVERALNYVASFENDPAAAPVLLDVSDSPGDQGSAVTVRWQPSPIDTGLVPGIVCCYQIQRRQLSPPGAQWSLIGSEPATSLANYSQSDSTASDSTLLDPAIFRYRLVALANGDTAHWVSNEVNGYSVDNLAPSAPASVGGSIASGFATLVWSAVSAADFVGYHVFRGLEASPPIDAAHLVGTTTATTFNDAPGFFAHYEITAFDVHGNDSPGTLFVPFNPADVPTRPAPKAFSVGSPFPSPMRQSMSITLGLPRAMNAIVDVLDSQGRLVRRLCGGEEPAGWMTLSWDGRDAGGRESAAGMYFVRVQTREGRTVSRLVLIP